MINDLEKGIGNLLGHEEAETKARRKAYYRELIRQKVEGPISVVSAPVSNVTATPVSIDITKYNGPPNTAQGHSRNKQMRMARQWLTDKNSGNSKGAWKDFVKERKDELKKQLNTKIEGAKILQKISDYDQDNEPNARKAHWVYDIGKKDFIDINEKKTKPMKMNDYINRINYLYGNDPAATDEEQRKTNEEPRKMNKEITNKERNVR